VKVRSTTACIKIQMVGGRRGGINTGYQIIGWFIPLSLNGTICRCTGDRCPKKCMYVCVYIYLCIWKSVDNTDVSFAPIQRNTQSSFLWVDFSLGTPDDAKSIQKFNPVKVFWRMLWLTVATECRLRAFICESHCLWLGLNHTVPVGWIGSAAPIVWPPKSPDLTKM